MEIRHAKEQDMDGINDLLMQVCLVHHQGSTGNTFPVEQ